jgi:hypothetical protein
MIKFLLLVLLLLELPGLKAQSTLDCGKYPTVTTYETPTCERIGVLPWLVGIPGAWETEVRLGVAGDTVRFSFSSSLPTFPDFYDVNLVLEDSQWGATFFEEIDHLDLPRYGSHWTRILGACHNHGGQCPAEPATGSLIVTADAPSAAALDAVSAFGVYKYTSNGSVISQATAPVIFLDQAAVQWSAIVTETPRDQQSQPDATSTSFAVRNLSPDPQAVLIRVYDERGNLATSGRTPVLDQAVGSVGGAYANTLSNVLAGNLPPNSCRTSSFPAGGFPCTGPPVFWGTVVFEGEKGGRIAPVVFRLNGPALTAVPVRAEPVRAE